MKHMSGLGDGIYSKAAGVLDNATEQATESIYSTVEQGMGKVTSTLTDNVGDAKKIMTDTLPDNITTQVEDLYSSTMEKGSDILGSGKDAVDSLSENKEEIQKPDAGDFPQTATDNEDGKATCPYTEASAYIELNSDAEIDKYFKETPSNIPPLYEVKDINTPRLMPKGIPIDNLDKKIQETISAGYSSENSSVGMVDLANELNFIDKLYDCMEKRLGSENFLKYLMLFNKEAQNNINKVEISIKLDGDEVKFEDAKFELDFVTHGAIIKSPQSVPYSGVKVDHPKYPIEHVQIIGNPLYTDDFKVSVAQHIRVYEDRPTPQPYIYGVGTASSDANVYLPFREASEKVVDQNLTYLEQESSQTVEALANEIVDKVLKTTKDNREIDIMRDIAVDVLDASLTIVAICSGTIAIKAAASAALRAARAGLLVIEYNRLNTTVDELDKRLRGDRAQGYDVLKSYAKYLDTKSGTGGHELETAFDTVNMLMVFGKTPKTRVITGSVSAGANASLSIVSRYLQDPKSVTVTCEKEPESSAN